MSTEKEKRIFREKKKLLSKLAMILCAVHNKCVKRNWLSMSCFDCLMLFCLFLFLFSGSTVCDSFRNKHVYFKNRFNYCKEQKIPLHSRLLLSLSGILVSTYVACKHWHTFLWMYLKLFFSLSSRIQRKFFE